MRQGGHTGDVIVVTLYGEAACEYNISLQAVCDANSKSKKLLKMATADSVVTNDGNDN